MFRRRPSLSVWPVTTSLALDTAFLERTLESLDRLRRPETKCTALIALMSIAPEHARSDLTSRLKEAMASTPHGTIKTQVLVDVSNSYGVEANLVAEATEKLIRDVESGGLNDSDLEILINSGFPTNGLNPVRIRDPQVLFAWQLANGHIEEAVRLVRTLEDQEVAIERVTAEAARLGGQEILHAEELPPEYRAYFRAQLVLAQALAEDLPRDGQFIQEGLDLSARIPDIPRRLEILNTCLVLARGTSESERASIQALAAATDGGLPPREVGAWLAKCSWYIADSEWPSMISRVRSINSDAGRTTALITIAHAARMREDDGSFRELRQIAASIQSPRWRARALLPFSRMSRVSLPTHWRLIRATLASNDKAESLKVLADRWPQCSSVRLLLRGGRPSDLDAAIAVLDRRKNKNLERYWPRILRAANHCFRSNQVATVHALGTFCWLLGPHVDPHNIRLLVLDFIDQMDDERSRATAIQHLTGGMILE